MARPGVLRRLRTSAADGGGGRALVVGEAGSGKSHLLDLLDAEARAAGTPVVRARAGELDRDVPHALIDLLPGAAEVRAAVAAGSGDERRWATHLAERWAGALLLLDDLHWADEASCAVLAHVLRRPPRDLRTVAAARDPRALPAFLIAELPEIVELLPLDAGEAERLTPGIPAGARERLRRASGGNALLLAELARAAASGGPVAATAVAPLVARRVGALGADARAVLEAAAAAGDPCREPLVSGACDVPAERRDAAWAELAATGLLVVGEPGRVAFRHPVVRAAVHDATPPGRRRALHARLAALLEGAGEPAQARAPHVAETAEPGDAAAVDVLVEAAMRARRLAPRSAVRWLEAAHRLSVGPAADREAAVAERLARLHLDVGSARACLRALARLEPPADGGERARRLAIEAAARRATGEVAGLAERLRSAIAGAPEPADAAALELELGAVHLESGDFPAAARHAGAAAHLLHHRAGVERVTPLALAAVSLCAAGRRPAGSRLLADVVALLDTAEEPVVEARTWAADVALYGLGRPAEALTGYRRAEEDALAAGAERQAVQAAARRALAAGLGGRVEEALAAAERCEDLAAGVDAPLPTGLAAVARCWAETWAGRPDRAAATIERHAATLAAVPVFGVRAVWSWIAGQAEVAGGRGRRAVALIEATLGADLRGGEPLGACFALDVLVQAHLAGADLEAAEAALHLVVPPPDLPLAGAVAGLARARVAHARGDLDACRRAAGPARATATACGATLVATRAGLVLGVALREAGDPEAERHAREVEATAWAAGLRVAGWVGDLPGREAPAAAAGPAAEVLARLTPRQRDVAVLLAEGRTNAEIAALLGLSAFTVGDHVGAVLRRLEVPRRAAVARAIGLGHDA